MKKIIAGILSLLIILSMSGCANKKNADITGSWYTDMYGKILTLNISEGGIYNMEVLDEAMIGTWVLEENTLYIDKGTAGEKSFSYDAAAQTLEQDGNMFTRKEGKAFKPGKTAAAVLEDFTGSWTATKADTTGALLPYNPAQFCMEAAFEGTKVSLTIGAEKEVQEGEAVFADGVLTLATAEGGVYTIVKMKDGLIRISAELESGPAVFYMEKVTPAA